MGWTVDCSIATALPWREFEPGRGRSQKKNDFIFKVVKQDFRLMCMTPQVGLCFKNQQTNSRLNLYFLWTNFSK